MKVVIESHPKAHQYEQCSASSLTRIYNIAKLPNAQLLKLGCPMAKYSLELYCYDKVWTLLNLFHISVLLYIQQSSLLNISTIFKSKLKNSEHYSIYMVMQCSNTNTETVASIFQDVNDFWKLF